MGSMDSGGAVCALGEAGRASVQVATSGGPAYVRRGNGFFSAGGGYEGSGVGAGPRRGVGLPGSSSRPVPLVRLVFAAAGAAARPACVAAGGVGRPSGVHGGELGRVLPSPRPLSRRR
ncbi:hypothetical protein [Streptomyces sp. NBC_00986]|uniref:hypothetical protein n=1 Tax=Streptomyces sp. NBC_00986 TaxID=2903702 RepID=UPI0038666750|nr:hypothetical protein OG504_38795 [Streptomyces sp. NBC_00986]